MAVEITLRLDLLGSRGGKRRLRRAERVQFVLRIEFRQHLVRLDLVAHPAFPLDDPPANAEGEVDLVLGPDIDGAPTDSPTTPFSTVTVRTGRGWGGSVLVC